MIVWNYAFIDRRAADFDVAAAFWTAVTGTSRSARRGNEREFATLMPPAGAAYLKMQGVRDAGSAHLDLATDDVEALTRAALRLGAAIDTPHEDWNVLRSPAGIFFCVTPVQGETGEYSHDPVSRLDQICFDIAPDSFEPEVSFWAALTGWPPERPDPEFVVLPSPASVPIRILIQRLDEPRAASAHLDFACADPAVTRAAHELLGATYIRDGDGWIVMRDPVGGTYCLTGRAPEP